MTQEFYNDIPGITVNITSPELCEALRQHCRDNRNTHTGEYPSLDSEVEAILYYFLIGANRTS